MDGKVIQSVQRAIDIMNCFDENIHELSLKEISEKVGLGKSTVHGIISTLMKNMYLQQDEKTSKYSLGVAFLERGFAISEDIIVRNIGHSYLKAISEEFQVTVNLFIYKKEHLKVVDRVQPEGIYYTIGTSVTKIPLNASASGKLALAYSKDLDIDRLFENDMVKKYTQSTITKIEDLKIEIEEIKKKGYSLEKSEVELGIYCISVPIFKNEDIFLGTISIMATKEKLTKIVSKLSKEMVKVSRIISNKLSGK